MWPCRSGPATATASPPRWNASTATSASWRSTRAPRRSSAWCWAAPSAARWRQRGDAGRHCALADAPGRERRSPAMSSAKRKSEARAGSRSNGRDPESSRREILEAAAEVFMEYGYAATSLDHVAERLGATKGRVYHYFPSKADLFLGIHQAAMETLIAKVEPLLDLPGTAAERLHAMAMAHARMLMTRSPEQKVAVGKLERHLLRGATARHQRTLQAIVRLRDDYEELFAEVLRDGMREGIFEEQPARLATKPLLGALNWLTVWYHPRRGETGEDIDVIARTIADFVVKGLRKGGPLP